MILVHNQSKIKDLQVFLPEIFYDHRGENFEGYNESLYPWKINDGNPLTFPVDSFSISKYNTLRGFHGDDTNWKLVECLQGSIILVVLDLRDKTLLASPAEQFFLNDKNRKQVLIPPGCVNAHYCMSDSCLFHYKLSHGYVPIKQQSHRNWRLHKHLFPGVENPITSERDK